MNNTSVKQFLDDSLTDLNNAMAIVSSMGPTSNIVPYLNKYSVIKACGAIEIAFKSIVTDFCVYRSKQQIKNYINNKVKDSSMNPSYSNICNLLKLFNDDWNKEFKQKIDSCPDKSQILTALQSLVDSRNDFAHGGNPTTSIKDSIDYYVEAVKMIEILDSIVI
jgi:hypothetical protein